MKIEYKCKNEECQHGFKVDYSGADQWGGGEISPDVCDKCGEEVDFDEVAYEAEPDNDFYNDVDR
jgi:hypothetical protein